MAAPQILAPGRPGWNLIVAAAACLVALMAVGHGTFYPSTTARGLDAVPSIATSPLGGNAAPLDGPAAEAAAAPQPTSARASTEVVPGWLPKTLAPTRFDVASTRTGAASAASGQPSRSAHPTATPTLEPGNRVVATVSFYYCNSGGGPAGDGGAWCGAMRDGTVVYPGAAACDYAYLGQRFRIEGDPTGRVYTCNDTGGKVHGLHRDIWFQTNDEGWRWQRAVGKRVVIEIVY